MKILGISGSLVGSKTKILTEIVLREVKDVNPESRTELLDLKDLNLEFCNGRPFEEYNEDTRLAISKFAEADAYVIGTSVMHGSFPGALKNLLDLIPTDDCKGKTVAFAATGGNPEHHKIVEHYLEPIAAYLEMNIVPDRIFTTSSDFDQQNQLMNQQAIEKVAKIARNFSRAGKGKIAAEI
ncbi:NADPH-dependent FMN reductase [Planococcus salinus]|uniref:NADPH-dependent oxidoreductase n=1 Tax=Planococcus salinus TaxID=1848460 RepID=A0A3M8P7Y8_9BACL|nr:NAD(P)H-dependent oxidoreductase [Planococcus salinus]RNF39795.1 NADPH-dependent oxidoreductase [Planococcus salinus]